jgi:hypothetical protein
MQPSQPLDKPSQLLKGAGTAVRRLIRVGTGAKTKKTKIKKNILFPICD